MSTDLIFNIREDYRLHLQTFYAHLNLAPPYHSIEKALQHLSNTLRTKPEPFLQNLQQDAKEKWNLYERIFEASGLSQKHRGIIMQKARTAPQFPMEESLRFLRIFIESPAPPLSKGTPLRS